MKRILMLLGFHFFLIEIIGQTYSARLNEIIQKNGDRPMIVEFFSSGCIVCFKGLPHLQQVKDQFKNDLSVLLIGKEDGKIQDTYEKYRNKFNLDIPVIFDSLIPKEIDVDIYPTVLWIKNGRVLGRTYSDALTTSNLQSFLDGSISDNRLKIKKRRFVGDTLYISNNRPLFQSCLFPANESTPIYIPSSLKSMKIPGSFQALNVTLERLYKYAYFFKGHWGVGDSLYGEVFPRIVFETGDTATTQNRRFCYIVTLPAPYNTTSHIQRQLQLDLESAFGYKANIETRLMTCWKLIALPGASKRLATRGGRLKQIHTHARVCLVNSPVADLIKTIGNKLPSPYPYIDATGFTHNIDIDIEAVLLDFEDFRKGLRAHKLDLVRDVMPMRVLVIKRAENAAAQLSAAF